MKSIFAVLAIVFVFVATSAVAEDLTPRIGGAVKVGYDFAGTQELSALGMSVDADTDGGVTLYGELLGHLTKNIDVGLGVGYQLARELSDYPGEFSFVPLYGTIKIRSGMEQIDPYLFGQLGYNFFDGDDAYTGTGIYAAELSGGMYYGGGFGFIIGRHFLTEVMYSVNNGSVEIWGYEGDVEYRKVSVNIGVNF